MSEKIKKLRNQEMTEGIVGAGNRTLLYALGVGKEEVEKPFIGIVNSWNEMHPGHKNLRELAAAVKEGVIAAGGQPFEFNTIALCDGETQGHKGMCFVLPSRDLIADSVEVMAEGQRLDGLVMLASCDKIVPAMAMAAGRLNIPAVIVTGGPMMPNPYKGRTFGGAWELREAAGKLATGEISQKDYDAMEQCVCGGVGSCPMMGTANTMQIVVETLGMSLPGNATVSAVDKSLLRYGREAGKQVIELWKKNIRPSDIITEKSVNNAVRMIMAMGGSTNTIIHVPAVATESELDMDCSAIYAAASEEIPLLVGIRPNGPHCMEDFRRAGGLGAVLHEIREHLDLTCAGVGGRTLGETIRDCAILDSSVIHTLAQPLSRDGGMALCRGNLVPEGAFIKLSAVPEALRNTFRGRARVFTSVHEATDALRNGDIHPGDAVLIIYQGVKAGPETAYNFTTELKGSPLKESVCVITDGRLSGAASGACFSYASPEAALRGPLCAVRDGDIITYDLPNRRLEVDLTPQELERRMAEAQLHLTPKKGYLKVYQHCVGSVLKGAVLT